MLNSEDKELDYACYVTTWPSRAVYDVSGTSELARAQKKVQQHGKLGMWHRSDSTVAHGLQRVELILLLRESLLHQ